MFSHSLSPLSSFPQTFFNGFDSENQRQSRNNEIEDNKLKNLSNQLLDDFYEPARQSKTNNLDTVSSRSAIQSLDTSTSQSAEIQIKTNEGDIVTISLNQATASHRSAFQIEQGNTRLSAYEESYSFESGFSIVIEGNLNEDEQKALKNLLNKINKISNDFFSGNVKKAFEKSLKLGFNTEQISSLSVDLNTQRSIHALAAYQQTISPDQNINTNLLKEASEFLSQAKESLANAKEVLDTLTEPEQYFTDFFATIGQLTSKTKEDIHEDKGDQLFLNLIENLRNELFEI